MSEQMKPSHAGGRMDWFLVVLLAISLAGNVLLGVGFFRLADRVGSASAQVRPEAADPKIGAHLPALDAQDLSGASVSLTYDSDPRPTVIYVFTPQCTWCARNLNNFKTVLTAGKQTYRFVGLSLNPDVTNYLKNAGIDLPVYINPSKDVVAAYGLAATPSTLVVSSGGILQKFWKGAYSAANKSDVQDFFHVSLPGLTTPSAQ